MFTRRWPNPSTAVRRCTPYRTMNWRVKLVLMNLAVAAALYYRWHLGAPPVSLAIAGVVMFVLVNGLLLLTRSSSASRRR